MAHLENALRINEIYSRQPLRVRCKTCLTPISDGKDFISHGVAYNICQECGHLNGLFEDTESFCEFLYSSSRGENYSANYLEDYSSRVENIYIPKVDFLIKSLEKQTCMIKNQLSLSDFGCGAGHLVHAANKLGLNACGLDISQDLIDVARSAYKQAFGSISAPPFVRIKDEAQLNSFLLDCDSQIVSFIGVLEHLRDPRSFFRGFTLSKSKYLYISVPLFSLSVFFENVFSNCYPRHLSGGHTHLYSHSSLKYLLDLFSLYEVSSWHFGTDAMDLRRSLYVSIDSNGVSQKAKDLLLDHFLSPRVMDQIQEVFDRNLVASEVHMVIGKRDV